MIHGIYHFGSKRVACRNDYCPTCGTACLAEGRRSYQVLHLFFVPVLHLGHTVRWFCPTCDRPTNQRPLEPFILLGGAIVGVLFAILGLIILFSASDHFTGLIVTTCGSLLAILTLRLLIQQNCYASSNRDLPEILPLPQAHCPYCHARTTPDQPPRCSTCAITLETRPWVE